MDGLFGRRFFFSLKKMMAAWVMFAKLHLKKCFWTDMSKVELFGHNAQNHMTVDDLGLF